MMNTLFLFLLLLFSSFNFVSTVAYTCDPTISCGCSVPSTRSRTARIVGGEIATNHAWNWMISLQLDGVHRCGASLLTPEYAVTAGHCVHGILHRIASFSILAGTNYLNDTNSTTVQHRSIMKIALHPNYAFQLAVHDIAIIKFSSLKTTPEYNLGFICLPNVNEDPFTIDTSAIALGWGHLSSSSTELSNELRQVTVQVVSSTSSACQRSDFSNGNVQFCAGFVEGGKDTCGNDSGGPLMVFLNNTWILAGITSLGKKCALKGHVGVYTRVSSFISFINATIEYLASDNKTDIYTTVPPKHSTSATKRSIESIWTLTLLILAGILFCFLILLIIIRSNRFGFYKKLVNSY